MAVEVTGKFVSLTENYLTGNFVIAFEINESGIIKRQIDSIKDLPKLNIKVAKWRQKRSTNANNYAWELISKIAEKQQTSKDEAYFLMLKRYGQQEFVSVASNVDVRGYFKYYEENGRSIIGGVEYTNYRIYKGSSEYNSKEMSILIDGIVSEAKELNIETLTPNELEDLKRKWNEKCTAEK